MGKSITLRAVRSFWIRTSRPGSWYGNGRSNTVLTTLKIAVVAPMPSAMVTIAVAAKPGLLRRVRAACARSLPNDAMRTAPERVLLY